MNLTYTFEHGDAVLITTFLILIGMSLVSWYVIFWKWWIVQRERSQVNHYKARYMNGSAWAKAPDSKAAKGGAALLLNQAVKLQHESAELDKGERKTLLELHLSQTLDAIRTRLDKGLTILASVGSSAPFIGLFGTVWGVYNALTRVAAEGNATLNVVAGPMGEALVATAVGLFAAIPAVLAYNAFVRTNRVLVQDLRHIAEQLTFSGARNSPHKTSSEPVKLVSGGN